MITIHESAQVDRAARWESIVALQMTLCRIPETILYRTFVIEQVHAASSQPSPI